MCRVLEMLQGTACIERIIVNTDSDTVAELALQFPKALIHDRPASLRGHHVSMNAVITHDLELLGPGHYLQTHVTNPLLTGKSVREAAELYFASLDRYDSLFSVTSHQGSFFDKSGRLMNAAPQAGGEREEACPLYEENSCLYFFSHDSFFRNGGNRIGRNFQVFPLSRMESLDIDDEEDFHLAEMAWKSFRK